jgi:hypothetical protein
VACALHAAKTLDIYFIDTEGGQATLVVSLSGQSLLIDTGYTGFGAATRSASPGRPRTPASNASTTF